MPETLTDCLVLTFYRKGKKYSFKMVFEKGELEDIDHIEQTIQMTMRFFEGHFIEGLKELIKTGDLCPKL